MRKKEDILLMLKERKEVLSSLHNPDCPDQIIIAKVGGQIEALNWVLEQETRLHSKDLKPYKLT